MKMRIKVMLLVLLIISGLALSGCQKARTTQAGDNSANAPAPLGEGGDASNPELDNVSRLIVGTLRLEGSDNAVTPQQAARLLPLWTLIQGGALTSDAETNAVVKQIEGQMTEAQLAAIDALGLTMEDVMAWMQEQGIEVAAFGDVSANTQGAPAGVPELSEQERAQMRERFENMTEGERAQAMAEGGFQRPEGAPDGRMPTDGQPPDGARQRIGGVRGGNVMLEPLIVLLTERAAQ
jgi:hypothetical protein